MAIKEQRKNNLECIALNLGSAANLYLTVYVVEDATAKVRLVERLRFLLKEHNVKLVEFDIVYAERKDIHGSVVITENGYYNEKPEWFKNSPFMLLIQNLENLSGKNPDNLAKLNKLAQYLAPTFGSVTDQVPVTLDEKSCMAAIITESDVKTVSSIVRRLGRNAQQAIRVKKVRENSEGRWENYT